MHTRGKKLQRGTQNNTSSQVWAIIPAPREGEPADGQENGGDTPKSGKITKNFKNSSPSKDGRNIKN